MSSLASSNSYSYNGFHRIKKNETMRIISIFLMNQLKWMFDWYLLMILSYEILEGSMTDRIEPNLVRISFSSNPMVISILISSDDFSSRYSKVLRSFMSTLIVWIAKGKVIRLGWKSYDFWVRFVMAGTFSPASFG